MATTVDLEDRNIKNAGQNSTKISQMTKINKNRMIKF